MSTSTNSTLTAPISIRLATLDDCLVIGHHRRAMFEDMGHLGAPSLEAMGEPFQKWIHTMISTKQYIGWLAETADKEVIAGVGLWIMPWAPTLHNVSGVKAHVVNVYTEAPFRGQGLAKRMMVLLIDYCKAHDFRLITLHASDQGRPIYESLGFKQTNEMRLDLNLD